LNKIFLKHINKYHPIEWLLKSVDLSRKDNTKFKNRFDISSTTPFLVIMSDVALRVSQNDKLYGHIPTDKEYEDFISMYINNQGKAPSKLLKEHGVLALSLLVTEQIRFIYPSVNLIGRLSLLYSQYEEEIFEITGLRITNIFTILIALMAFYKKSEHYSFEIKNIAIETISGLNQENVENFVNYFSTDIRGYRTELKKLGFDKRQLYSFRLLEKKPIIKFNANHYILPSIDNLLYSLTSGMNIHLLTHFSEQGRGKEYLDSLGVKFEDYVRLLTGKVFDNIIEAKDVVPRNTENAEFVINYDNTAIVVEVKKFILLRDSAFKDNIDDLVMLLERHIVKAYKQIETTFKYVEQENKIGIIVTLGDVNMQTAMHDYIRTNYKDKGIKFLDNIIIMSIGAYESLLANTKEDIMKILNHYLCTDKNDKSDILLTINTLEKETINPFLETLYSAEFAKIKPIKPIEKNV